MKVKNMILITLLAFMFMCKQVQASDTYTIDSDFTVYIGATDTTTVYSLPPLRYVPNVTKVTSNYLNVTVGNATYEFKHSVDVTSGNPYNNYTVYSTKISGGNNAGQIVGYTQEFTYLNTDEDLYQLNFYISQRRAGSGTITLQAYNDGWVTIEVLDFNGNYTSGDILPNANVKGWKYIVNYAFNNPWTLLRYDDMYTDGYILNDFYINIKNSQEQQQDALDNIASNTERSNGLLGSILSAINGLVDSIMNGLKSLFIPSDPYNDLQSGVEDILDSLGIIGYPITFYTDTLTIIKDTDTESLSINIPAFYYKNRVIFPQYYRDDIFYFRNSLVFTNVQKTTWFRNFFQTMGVNIETVTIGELVKSVMSFSLLFGLIGFLIRTYNNTFGTDVEEGDDEDDI